MEQVHDVELAKKFTSSVFKDFYFSYVRSVHSTPRTLASIKVADKDEERVIENARESFSFEENRIYYAVDRGLAH